MDLPLYFTAIFQATGKKGRKRYKGTNTITEVQREAYQQDTTNTRQYKGKRGRVLNIWVKHEANRSGGVLKLLYSEVGITRAGWVQAKIKEQEGLYRIQYRQSKTRTFSFNINVNVLPAIIQCKGNNRSDVTISYTAQVKSVNSGGRFADIRIVYEMLVRGQEMQCLKF